MDGTLIDSLSDVPRIFGEVLSAKGVDPTYAENFFHENTGLSMAEMLCQILDHFHVHHEQDDIDAIRWEFERLFYETEANMFPGATILLRKLHVREIHLYLSSWSSQKMVKKRLFMDNISSLFRLSLGSSTVAKGTAHLEIFARTAGVSLDTFCAKAFFCGDMQIDMEIAKSHGMYGIGVAGTITAEKLIEAGADRVINSIDELLIDENPGFFD